MLRRYEHGTSPRRRCAVKSKASLPDDPPELHHEFHILQDADMFQRITVDSDDIGDHADLQRPQCSYHPLYWESGQKGRLS